MCCLRSQLWLTRGSRSSWWKAIRCLATQHYGTHTIARTLEPPNPSQTHRTAGLRTSCAFQLGEADFDYRHAESGRIFCRNICPLYAPPPLMSKQTLYGHLSIARFPFSLLVFRRSKVVQMTSLRTDLTIPLHFYSAKLHATLVVVSNPPLWSGRG